MNILLLLLNILQVYMNTHDKKETELESNGEVPAKEKERVGYRDDILMVLFLIPVVGVFLPWTRDSIREGLAILNDIPDWFSLIIVLTVISIFGFRKQLTEILTNFTNFRKK